MATLTGSQFTKSRYIQSHKKIQRNELSAGRGRIQWGYLDGNGAERSLACDRGKQWLAGGVPAHQSPHQRWKAILLLLAT